MKMLASRRRVSLLPLDRLQQPVDSDLRPAPVSFRGIRAMPSSIRTGLFSAAFVTTVLLSQSTRSAPPEAKNGEDAQTASAETAARIKLSEKGIHVSHSGLSLVDEKQLAHAFNQANTLKRKLVTTAKELQAGERGIEQIQADVRQRLQNSVEINSTLANVRNNPVE